MVKYVFPAYNLIRVVSVILKVVQSNTLFGKRPDSVTLFRFYLVFKIKNSSPHNHGKSMNT